MFSFVVNNDAEYYDQINMTALWDKFKKKSSVASWTSWIKDWEFSLEKKEVFQDKIPKF